jgi:predicted nucleic acid-binding protein
MNRFRLIYRAGTIIIYGRNSQQTRKMTISPRPIIVDADALIALVDTDDPHSPRAFAIAKHLQETETPLVYPATTIAEAATTFQRKLNKPALVAQIVAAVSTRQLLIEPVDADVLDAAAALFKPHGSKHNTIFDAIVAALAHKHHAQAVFSFDDWYEKVGLRLIGSQV